VIDRVQELVQKAIVAKESDTIEPVRLLLLDMQMPIKNGLQVVDEVKSMFEVYKR
jgi:CheY-like chemotaxis protein